MATVFMKWLETSPESYDRGIRLLTLGRLSRAHEQIISTLIQPRMRVLEIGCGTGALSVRMAQQGAEVVGIDISPQMLGVASQRAIDAGLQDKVSLKLMDAAMVGDIFQPQSFDRVVASLSFSEMTPEQQGYILAACRDLLAPDGRLVVVDEVRPPAFWARLLYWLVRIPLALVTWLLTRASTSPLAGLEAQLGRSGYRIGGRVDYLGGSLALIEATPDGTPAAEGAVVLGRLEHRVTWKTRLKDLYLLFNRLIPPYLKVHPGLYAVGAPDEHAPVLVTGNFDLTVRRLVRAIDGKVDAWVLVVDTAGINVWCAAGGGFLTAEKVSAAVKTSRVEEVVAHHALILPQLAAAGVDGWGVRKQTGWGVHWGPVRAEDIPAYLAAGRQKDEAMRRVAFPLGKRLEMVTVTLAFYALMILIPVLVFWRGIFLPVTASLLGLAYFYAVVHPWLPGRDGLEKSIPLAVIALAGFGVYLQFTPMASPLDIFRWGVGLVGLAVFSAAEMQGMSPHMRGEQANWTVESVVFTVLAVLYFGIPPLVGWS